MISGSCVLPRFIHLMVTVLGSQTPGSLVAQICSWPPMAGLSFHATKLYFLCLHLWFASYQWDFSTADMSTQRITFSPELMTRLEACEGCGIFLRIGLFLSHLTYFLEEVSTSPHCIGSCMDGALSHLVLWVFITFFSLL